MPCSICFQSGHNKRTCKQGQQENSSHTLEKKKPDSEGLLTCPCCYEEKPYYKMTNCLNGHPGGCQKCHLMLFKTTYETRGYEFDFHTSSCECCFLCRRKIPVEQMGIDYEHALQKLLDTYSPSMSPRLLWGGHESPTHYFYSDDEGEGWTADRTLQLSGTNRLGYRAP